MVQGVQVVLGLPWDLLVQARRVALLVQEALGHL